MLAQGTQNTDDPSEGGDKQPNNSSPSLDSVAPQYVSSDPEPNNRGTPPDVLLCVFIHGFKGTDLTFFNFPARLQHILSETLDNVKVECIVFPSYETKGDLNEAVIRFADWLTELTVTREVANGVGGGAGKAKIVLCGHSMGGLLAADSLLQFINTRPDQAAPLWPNIIACIAFDTPYLGLHPSVFKNSATKASQYLQTAHKAASSLFSTLSTSSSSSASSAASKAPLAILPPSSDTVAAASNAGGWGKWAPVAYGVGGALLAGAAAGTAYYKKQELATGVGAVTKGVGSSYVAALDHMKYVGNLWDEGALWRRLETLSRTEDEFGVVFRTFFTSLPSRQPVSSSKRTFITLPPPPPKRPASAPRANSATTAAKPEPGVNPKHSSQSSYRLPPSPSPSPQPQSTSQSQPQSRATSPPPPPSRAISPPPSESLAVATLPTTSTFTFHQPHPNSIPNSTKPDATPASVQSIPARTSTASPANKEKDSSLALTRYNRDYRHHFVEQRNGKAPDEVQAHMGMFEVQTNDGYYEMGLMCAKMVREALDEWRVREQESGAEDKRKAEDIERKAKEESGEEKDVEIMNLAENTEELKVDEHIGVDSATPDDRGSSNDFGTEPNPWAS